MLKGIAKYHNAKNLPQGKNVIQVSKADATPEQMACILQHNNSIDYRKLLLIVMKYFEKKGSTHGLIAALVMKQEDFDLIL